eukprot:5984216-Pyramimonas_sp.AAC.1
MQSPLAAPRWRTSATSASKPLEISPPCLREQMTLPGGPPVEATVSALLETSSKSAPTAEDVGYQTFEGVGVR